VDLPRLVRGRFCSAATARAGTIYLLTSRRFADLSLASCRRSLCSPARRLPLALDLSLAELTACPEGPAWSWVRLVSPFINLYAVIFLSAERWLALRWRH
jgi:hypothetical protein